MILKKDKSLKASFLIIIFQREVRKVYKTLFEEDEHFEGWNLGHGYVHLICYWDMHVSLVRMCEVTELLV